MYLIFSVTIVYLSSESYFTTNKPIFNNSNFPNYGGDASKMLPQGVIHQNTLLSTAMKKHF